MPRHVVSRARTSHRFTRDQIIHRTERFAVHWLQSGAGFIAIIRETLSRSQSAARPRLLAPVRSGEADNIHGHVPVRGTQTASRTAALTQAPARLAGMDAEP